MENEINRREPGTTPESRRLKIVYTENYKSLEGFGKDAEISRMSISRMLSGKQEMNFRVVKHICIKLGYSSDWLLTGEGVKKKKAGEVKLVTEIQTLRAEIELSAKLTMVQQARIKGIEKEYDNLKKDHEELKKQVLELQLKNKTV